MIWIRQCLLCGVATVALLSVFGATATAGSQTLFWDQMNSNSQASWGENSTADTAVTWGYDYSADDIPEAPHSQGGDDATTGVKLEANIVQPGGSEQISLYPIGGSFSGRYRLSFDAWMNYDVEEFFGDAVGTTEFLGGGVGYDDIATDVGSGAQTIGTGDGGSSNDHRAFKSDNAGTTLFIPDAGMASGDHNANQPYWESFFPGQTPPAGQGQAAISGNDGTSGFQWVTWNFSVQNDIVRVDFEKPNGAARRVVEIDCADTSDGSNGCVTNGNIMLFYADFFSSVSPRAVWTFGVIDNVHVTEIPEPSSAVLCAVALVGLLFGRRRH